MIIGITGNKRHGKDTIADHLVNKYSFSKYALADPMKKVAGYLFKWSSDFMENNKETIDEEYGISPRQFLQKFGTEFMQDMLSESYPQYKETTGRNFWVNHLLKELEGRSLMGYCRFAISDIRFPHELEVVRRNPQNIIIKVIRPSIEVDTSHSSEQYVTSFEADYTLINDGSIKDLQDKIDKLIPFLPIQI
jgi:hypothetical protein